ncbi:MAG TPA: response regulator [Patescibacteria group bacterium]|nr:response regulator [Patescibacteria group bacterium]HLP48473.1 response regulator [Candidatus Kapabacteria bacterium]
MSKKRILVIEDEVSLNQALVEFLSSETFEVFSAHDGEEGIRMTKSKKPDLVLLDIILPKKDGYEVLEELKANEETKNIPVILLTNLESAQDVQKAFDKGATTYLVKSSYKMEDIEKKIKETLNI